MTTLKFCPRCKKKKRRSNFNKCKSRKDGLHCWCKGCRSASSKQHSKSYVGIEKSREYFRRACYGLEPEDFDLLYAKQKGCCAICGLPEISTYQGRLRALCVDHNHLTGEIRGLLCQKCNCALGYFNVDLTKKVNLKNAIKYLDSKRR